jgi:hypothetical protein
VREECGINTFTPSISEGKARSGKKEVKEKEGACVKKREKCVLKRKELCQNKEIMLLEKSRRNVSERRSM